MGPICWLPFLPVQSINVVLMLRASPVPWMVKGRWPESLQSSHKLCIALTREEAVEWKPIFLQ